MAFDPEQGTLKLLKQRYSEASKRTVFFVGAGCSTEVGLPDWRNLAEDLFSRLDDATPSTALTGELLNKFHSAGDLKNIGDYWNFFGLVEGTWKTLYEDFLSETFSSETMEKLEIPSVYKKIWRMRNVGQILTLNIDGLVQRAYEDAFGTKRAQLLEFPGTSVTDSRSYFDRNFPTILNLHGKYTQRSTWVMSASERSRLFDGFGRGDYKSFMRHIFESYNIVFVGLNIRDVAVSPIIEEIANSGLLQDHFWIVPNISTENYIWAQSKGVRVVNYEPEAVGSATKVHSTVICSILDDIESHKSFDRTVLLPKRPEAVGAQFDDVSDLLPLAMKRPHEARVRLDSRIEHLGQTHGFDGKQLSSFIREYSVPLELSSVLGTSDPYNMIEDLQVSSILSESNASTVWMARDTKNDKLYAVKVLSGQAFKDRIERESFRRGIESLFQLNKLNNPVAPRFYFHTNTPLAVAMELIEGATLVDLYEGSRNVVQDHWQSAILKICKSLLMCHTSEGEVLHRDIKPKNIILEGVYVGCDGQDFLDAKVRFINFDMSWHKFSAGNTKSVSADEIGYYAPEQRNLSNSDSPRTAKTDVYMLGMTLFNLLSDIPPPEGGARVKDWDKIVDGKIRIRIKEDKLAASRISRLIRRMTDPDPDKRPDLQSVISDLEVVGYAMQRDWQNTDPDLLVEKLLTECDFNYEWNEADIRGTLSTPRQIELSLGYLPRGQRIEIRWMRQRDEGADRRNFGGKLGELADMVKRQLSDGGWQVEEGGGHHSRSISANIQVRSVIANWDGFQAKLQDIVKKLMGNV